MVNIGFLGVPNSGKTSLLRNFIKFIREERFKQLNIQDSYKLISTDFSGESQLINFKENVEDFIKLTKTIYPNKVVFQNLNSGHFHTIFDPGGDNSMPIVKIGIITITRISNIIIAIITLDQPIKDQLKFFESIRYLPKKIFVCINKMDLINKSESGIQLEYNKDTIESSIKKQFGKQKTEVIKFFYTCSEEITNFYNYCEEAFKMVLEISNYQDFLPIKGIENKIQSSIFA